MSSAIYNYPPDYVPLLVKCNNIYSLKVHNSLRDWTREYITVKDIKFYTCFIFVDNDHRRIRRLVKKKKKKGNGEELKIHSAHWIREEYLTLSMYNIYKKLEMYNFD